MTEHPGEIWEHASGEEFGKYDVPADMNKSATYIDMTSNKEIKFDNPLVEQLKQRDETIKQLKEALKGERNKAIDECMREIERLNDDGVLYESTARKVLEFLKSDSKMSAYPK